MAHFGTRMQPRIWTIGNTPSSISRLTVLTDTESSAATFRTFHEVTSLSIVPLSLLNFLLFIFVVMFSIGNAFLPIDGFVCFTRRREVFRF